jgi:hypothetical protein
MEPDLCDLISAWLGHDVEPARRDELLARLRADEPFRRAFVAEIRMLGKLKVVQSPEPRWLRLEDEMGWSAADAAMAETLEDRVVRRLDAPPPSQRRRAWAVARWVAAAAALVALAVAVPRLIRRPEPDGVVQVPAARPYPKVDTVNGLAMVVRLDGVTWEPSADPTPVAGDVLAAGRFRFARGRAVLSMLTGVRLDVEGPADVEIVGPDKVVCHRGRIRARVPDGAEGFVVLGPSSAVVDLGTEFGLNVGADGKMQGRVFEGRLEAALLDPEGLPQRSYFLDAAQAGTSQAFEVDSGSRRIDEVHAPGDFLAATDTVAPALALDPGYPAAVLASKPWGYWRFESQADGRTPNEVAGRPPLRAVVPIRPGQGVANGFADFRPAKTPQYLRLEEPLHPTWKPGFAVEFWCLADAIQHASLVSIVTPSGTDHHVYLMELTSRNRLTIHKPASVRLLHRWPQGWQGGDNTFSRDPYVPYRWQHIVGQVRGDRIELFADGEPAGSAPIRPEHGDVACQLVLGRLTTQPGSGLSIDRPFVGRLDEFALYDHPLTPEEIRAHYRLGARK